VISEDEALRKASELHPELQNWTPGQYERAERKGVNWRLHVQIDAVVLRRMSDPGLPDAAVVSKLEEQGVPRLDAIHQIARIVVEDIWERMKEAEGGSQQADPKSLEEYSQEKNAETNRKIEALATVS
jgi:hypothetical protein